DRLFQAGAHRAARHDAGGVGRAVRANGIPLARDPLAGDFQSDELALQAFRLLLLQRLAADEPAGLVELHDPAEARLERRVLLVHVVAVQAKRDLEPQRVARAEAARHRALFDERVPQLAGAVGRNEDLESVLAGVAGAGDDAPRHA